jgi:hypothetical protein
MMKPAARKTVRSARTSAPMMKAAKVNKTAPASHDAIAARAYELYLARGEAAGHAGEDWLKAEAELNGG